MGRQELEDLFRVVLDASEPGVEAPRPQGPGLSEADEIEELRRLCAEARRQSEAGF